MSISQANGVSLLFTKTLLAGANVTLTETDTTVTIAASGGGGGGISDGDKGDITVSGSGTVWTIDNGAVTLAKTSGVQKEITSGTAAPSGGSDGDIYLQYV